MTTSTKLAPVTMRREQLIEAWGVLTAVGSQQPLPTATKWRLTKLIADNRSDMENFEARKSELLPKYGTPLPQTDEQISQGAPLQYHLTPENQKKMRADLAPILDEIVELRSWKRLGPTDFGPVLEQIQSNAFLVLLPFLDEVAFDDFADGATVPGIIDVTPTESKPTAAAAE